MTARHPLLRRVGAGLASCGRAAVDLVFPATCAACRAEPVADAGLCERCNLSLLSAVATAYCPRCGTSLGPNIPARPDGCWACPNPLPRFARVVRLGPYAAPLRPMIRGLKYRADHGQLGRLARMLAHAVLSQCPEEGFDVVVPVPAYWLRRLGRPTDHSRALAEALASELLLPTERLLARVRNTPPQVHLARSRRLVNVRGAFRGRGGDLGGACVLLVDDVTTTGATANEAARALLDAGAGHVFLAVLAKSDPPRAYADHLRARS